MERDAGAEEAGLVERIAAGSESALAALYDRHAAVVFRAALALSRDHGTAEEVVQETFLTLWNRAELFDPELGSLTAWLLTIARNRTIDRIRSAGRRVPAAPFSQLVGDEPDAASVVDWLVASGDILAAGAPEAGPERAFAASEVNVAMATAIAGLDPVERLTILLAYRDGLSQSEIAAKLDWPIGTVKTRSRRALRHLREALDEAADREPVAVRSGDRSGA